MCTTLIVNVCENFTASNRSCLIAQMHPTPHPKKKRKKKRVEGNRKTHEVLKFGCFQQPFLPHRSLPYLPHPHCASPLPTHSPAALRQRGQGPGCSPPPTPIPAAVPGVPGRAPGGQSKAGAGGPRTPNAGRGAARQQGAAPSEAGGQGGAAGLAASKRELTAEPPRRGKAGWDPLENSHRRCSDLHPLPRSPPPTPSPPTADCRCGLLPLAPPQPPTLGWARPARSALRSSRPPHSTAPRLLRSAVPSPDPPSAPRHSVRFRNKGQRYVRRRGCGAVGASLRGENFSIRFLSFFFF